MGHRVALAFFAAVSTHPVQYLGVLTLWIGATL